MGVVIGEGLELDECLRAEGVVLVEVSSEADERVDVLRRHHVLVVLQPLRCLHACI